jgi:hypothetical protein
MEKYKNKPNLDLQAEAMRHELHLRTIQVLGSLITPNAPPKLLNTVESTLLSLIQPFNQPIPNATEL